MSILSTNFLTFRKFCKSIKWLFIEIRGNTQIGVFVWPIISYWWWILVRCFCNCHLLKHFQRNTKITKANFNIPLIVQSFDKCNLNLLCKAILHWYFHTKMFEVVYFLRAKSWHFCITYIWHLYNVHYSIRLNRDM